jgi:2'-5' RNA ligase
VVDGLARIFAGVPLGLEARLALEDRLAGREIPGRPLPPDNWHLTLRFLGSVDEVTYERFVAGLDSVDLGPSFQIGLAGLGAFPNPRRATVLWAGLDRGVEELAELAELAEEAAQGAGLAAEDRPFRPHLTLSRIRPQTDVGALLTAVGELGISWRCDRIVVYRSHLGRGGARYEPLETLDLDR